MKTIFWKGFAFKKQGGNFVHCTFGYGGCIWWVTVCNHWCVKSFFVHSSTACIYTDTFITDYVENVVAIVI